MPRGARWRMPGFSDLKIELASAQKRVFLRDGANDVPYSQQQRDRLVLRRQDLETEMLQQRSRALQLDAEIAEERNRLNRISHSDLLLAGGSCGLVRLGKPRLDRHRRTDHS